MGYHRTGHLRGLKQCAEPLHEAHIDSIGQRRRAASRLDRGEVVARLAGEILARCEFAAGCSTTSGMLPAISTMAAARPKGCTRHGRKRQPPQCRADPRARPDRS